MIENGPKHIMVMVYFRMAGTSAINRFTGGLLAHQLSTDRYQANQSSLVLQIDIADKSLINSLKRLAGTSVINSFTDRSLEHQSQQFYRQIADTSVINSFTDR